ncbi:MAG TPA: transglycosylase SLT domain-containing protein [Pyrinomonadaceae bacterium]|nr:transglycosylase SLT domain-containing protein [Pyrinomonadaceae bacterium]
MKLAALILALFAFTAFGQTSDAALRRITESDKASRDASGKLPVLTAAEHLSRAETYMANRLFPQAREHWAIVMREYPTDAGIPKALFGTGRSYMWEREYGKAVEWFDKLTKDFLSTKDGREGLNFKGASYVRMNKHMEAVKAYEQYTVMFPEGERIESAHLNIIDALREAGKYDDANKWVATTVTKFAGKPTEINAMHARLRMEIYRENWNGAISVADSLLNGKSFAGSMSTADEVKYLKAFAQSKLSGGNPFASISPSASSYFSGLAADRAAKGSNVKLIASVTPKYYSDYPVMFQADLLREAKKRKVDPRFMLAIMKQESSFRPNAKSPAGARGLLQFVYDTAIKYKDSAGYKNLQPDDLYNPSINIALGAEYIRFLKDEFGGLYEGIAASYNAGEDNALRWLNRSKPKDPGIFTAEVGFAETKNYVYKVMTNYRIYRELYDENLQRR